jgi:Mlc titration factor MtfA (ptsG expression regulator)
VLFSWLDERRRRRLLETPFPEEWKRTLERNMVHFGYLDAGEQQRLCQLVQLFVAEKEWEGVGGLELTDEMKVTIAGQACLLLLGLVDSLKGPELYANVETILVYPSTFIPRRQEESIFAIPGIEHPMLPLIGEAHRRGPVILTWAAVRRSGRHPEVGHNVVYHEFAHKLDMLDGAVDGVPPLGDKEEYERWNRVCKAEYERLRALSDAGREGVLDPYGSTDEAEFFAVVTEAFFDAPIDLAEEYPALYEVLSAFYRQDTAARQRRALAGSAAPSDARQ